MDLLDHVTVDPHVCQRARNQRQAPTTEQDPQVQAVKNLHQVDVLGVAATPRSPQIAQSLQARRLIHTPRARVHAHSSRPAGRRRAGRELAQPLNLLSVGILELASHTVVLLCVHPISAAVCSSSSPRLSGTVAIRSWIVAPVPAYAASRRGVGSSIPYAPVFAGRELL